jgi:maltose alpha-D-glucosyltransferase/alpha-amylase
MLRSELARSGGWVEIEDLWYKDAIVYCLDVGTFADGNDDGYGDFRGLTRRLDHIASLGATCIWLLPFQPTPDRDNGYDITDFYGVDPRHGSLGDFVEFIHEARLLGIRVLIDLVVNHTSDQHPWFRSARADPRSPYRDWYVWSRRRPANYREGIVFPGSQKTTWTYDARARAYYFHRFYPFQPDLNNAHPAVRLEMRRILSFWIELGVAGFRVDAIPFIIERKGAGAKGPPDDRFLDDLRDYMQWRYGESVLLGEANLPPAANPRFFGAEGDRLQMLFNFFVNQRVFYAFASGDARPLASALARTADIPPNAQWGHFLRNNDELDLGRLTPAQRERTIQALGPKKTMQAYGRGLRRRLAPMLDGDQRRLELAYSLLLTLPGTPVLRYGDEIGMGEDLRLPERMAARTPMQWSDAPHGGFTRAGRPWLPVVSDPLYGYRTVNVARQLQDPASLLRWMQHALGARRRCREFGRGRSEILPTDPAVLALRYSWRGHTAVAVHNFAASARTVELSRPDAGSARLTSLLGGEGSTADARGRHRIRIEGYGYRWLRSGDGVDVTAPAER